jgi:hypothetical protein
VTSNIARLRVDRVFQGKVPARELEFIWYSLHWPKTRMGVIYSGPPLAAFHSGKRYLIFLKRRALTWEVAMPLYELDVELAPELPPDAPGDLSLLSPPHRYASVAEELEAAALAQPPPTPGTTGNAAATFPWVFDLLGGCAKPFYRHFMSVPSPELRAAASSWLKLVESRHLQCEQSDTSGRRQKPQ